MGCGRRSNVGRVYKQKRWAKRFAAGRPVQRVKGGYRIGRGRKRR